ncbi:MAG TPA: hypothetical protein VM370_06140 [Candidatus Thermoplasmatota archaeon]|nr:hypothetical protein [Candidatus Thermoplasmatota archaeon]
MSQAKTALLLLLLATPAASAAISLVATSSTLTTSAVAPPVTLALGAAGSSARYFSSWTLSSNATSVTGTVLGRAGADWYAKGVFDIVNGRTSAQTVLLSSTQLTNAQLDVFVLYVYNGTTLVGSFDLEAASPSLTFTLPASTTYRLDMRLDLADGAGNHNAPSSLSLALRVGSGGILVTHATSAPSLTATTVQVPFGKLVAGSSVGSNATNATGSAAAAVVVAGTTDYFYLNNTATSASFVKIVETSAGSGVSALTTMNLGVTNSTGSSVNHVTLANGGFTQTSGSYQRLEPSSTNRIYVRSLEGVLFGSATVTFDVYVSDTSAGDSYIVSKGSVTLT